MKKWHVMASLTAVQYAGMTIEAENEEKARVKALEILSSPESEQKCIVHHMSVGEESVWETLDVIESLGEVRDELLNRE